MAKEYSIDEIIGAALSAGPRETRKARRGRRQEESRQRRESAAFLGALRNDTPRPDPMGEYPAPGHHGLSEGQWRAANVGGQLRDARIPMGVGDYAGQAIQAAGRGRMTLGEGLSGALDAFDMLTMPADLASGGLSAAVPLIARKAATRPARRGASRALNATDRPRVDFPSTLHPPELTRKSVGKNPYRAGAPMAVRSSNDEAAILDDYLSGAEQGAIGRNWYDEVSDLFDLDVGNVAGARPGSKEIQAGTFGAFSPRTSVKANELARVRANNQWATGQDVAAATGPRNRSAQLMLDEGKFPGSARHKVDTFTMSSAGIKPPRGTHDFRDAHSWGFSMDETNQLGQAQHRWMDEMADKAVAEANRRRLGGYSDWNHERLQAARWVKHKADETGKTPNEIIQEMGQQRESMSAKVFSEAVPSGEIVDLNRLNDASRDMYTRVYAEKFRNPQGQNALAHQQGLLAPDEIIARGDWEGGTTPNIVTTVLADPGKGKAGDVISDWSDEAVKFHSALRGLLGGQADVATSYIRPPKRVGDVNSAVIPLNHKVTEADRDAYKRAIQSKLKENNVSDDVIVNYRSDDAIEVTWLGSGDNKKFRTVVDDVTNGRAVQGRNSGGLLTYSDEYKPSQYMPMLQNQKMRAAINDMLPRIAESILKDVGSLPLTRKGKTVYKTALKIMRDKGIDGVEDAVKQGILPSAILGAIVLSASQAPAQQAGMQDQI